jgi:hypothetical protein
MKRLIIICVLVIIIAFFCCRKSSESGFNYIDSGTSQNIGINNSDQAATLSFVVKATDSEDVSPQFVIYEGGKIKKRKVVVSDDAPRKYAITVPAHGTVDIKCDKGSNGCYWK